MNIEEIRQAFLSGGSVEYKAHCQKRMLERGITRKDIENCILNGEIIEDYPLNECNISDKSFPSCLVLWIDIGEDKVLHVVIGYKERKIIIISAYRPNSEQWESDFRTRKER